MVHPSRLGVLRPAFKSPWPHHFNFARRIIIINFNGIYLDEVLFRGQLDRNIQTRDQIIWPGGRHNKFQGLFHKLINERVAIKRAVLVLKSDIISKYSSCIVLRRAGLYYASYVHSFHLWDTGIKHT